MITREKLEMLKSLTESSGERFDFGGLPLPEIWDTISKLLAVKEAAEKVLQTLNQGHFVDGPGHQLLKALEACSDPEGAK
jgi:hypothetical protein